MKFLRALGSAIVMLLVMAAVAGLLWYFYGDYLMASMPSFLQGFSTLKEDLKQSEENVPMEQLLDQAYTLYVDETLIQCESTLSRPDDHYYGAPTVTTWDKKTNHVRQILDFGSSTRTYIQGPYNPDTYLSDSWLHVTRDETSFPSSSITYCPDGNWNNVATIEGEPDTWYHFESLYEFPFTFGTDFDNCMPVILFRGLSITGYELVGKEECCGQQATHYIVTHKPRMLKQGSFGEQFYLQEEESWAEPREFFEKTIPQSMIDQYPAFCEAFMELVENRFYRDGQTHFWFAEDGSVLKLQWDETFENNYVDIMNGDFDHVFRMLDSFAAGDDTYADFAQLLPVIRTASFRYGSDAEPIVIPEADIDLAP